MEITAGHIGFLTGSLFGIFLSHMILKLLLEAIKP
jgi:hypothetical protein